MRAYLRRVLRTLVGWEEIPNYDQRFSDVGDLLRQIAEHQDAIDARLGRLSRKDHAGQQMPITDWETAQAIFLNNPQNFEAGKEN